MSEIHQKSEGCWCGANINAEGSEEDVILACRNFRMYHSHREPSKTNLAEVIAILTSLKNHVHSNSHDLGEFGKVIKLAYLDEFLNEVLRSLKGRDA